MKARLAFHKQKHMAFACFLVLAFLHAGLLLQEGVSATNVHVVNSGGSTVCAKYWVPMNQVGGGCRELRGGQAWSPAWQAATLWAIVGGCAGQPCNTGPPTGVTQFEFTVGGFSNTDYYDVSMRAGFNLGLRVTPPAPARTASPPTAAKAPSPVAPTAPEPAPTAPPTTSSSSTSTTTTTSTL